MDPDYVDTLLGLGWAYQAKKMYPEAIAPTRMLSDSGEIMVCGDHRQLSPIIAHDWEREDRPPVTIYQPYSSAYDAVLRLREEGGLSDQSIRRSLLATVSDSHRLSGS